MIYVEVKVNITPALLRVNRIAGRFSNFTPLIGGRVDVLTRRLIAKQFSTQGRAGGRGSWRSLTEAYSSWKRAAGYGRRPLMQLSGRLFRALTKRKAEGQVIVTSPDSYTLTVSPDILPRLRAHQLGLANNPVRQVIPDPLPKSFIQDLRKAVRSYVTS